MYILGHNAGHPDPKMIVALAASILCCRDELNQTPERAVEKQNYQPIACGLHEQYQLAAIRGSLLDMTWRDRTGESMSARLRVLDVATRDGAEFLSIETLAGDRNEIRLDRITRAVWAENGIPLDPLA